AIVFPASVPGGGGRPFASTTPRGGCRASFIGPAASSRVVGADRTEERRLPVAPTKPARRSFLLRNRARGSLDQARDGGCAAYHLVRAAAPRAAGFPASPPGGGWRLFAFTRPP